MWREHEIYTEIRKVSGSEKSEVLPKMSETLAAGSLEHTVRAPSFQKAIAFAYLSARVKLSVAPTQ